MGTHYQQGTAEQIAALNAYIKLWRASTVVEQEANRHLLEYNLTSTQFNVLEALHHLGPLSQRKIAEKILRSSSNLSLVIENLVRRQLVTRQRHASDRRVFIIQLTVQGRELIESIFPQHVDGITQVLSVLEPAEIEQLSSLSRKLGHALQNGHHKKKKIPLPTPQKATGGYLSAPVLPTRTP